MKMKSTDSYSKMDGLISQHFFTEELNLQGHVAAYSVAYQ